jgi:hypothetical protein
MLASAPSMAPHAPAAEVAVGTAADGEQALRRALDGAGFATAPLAGRVALAVAPGVRAELVAGLRSAAEHAGAAGVDVVAGQGADLVDVDAGPLGRVAVPRAWHDADLRILVAHNRAHRRWLYLGALSTALRPVHAPARLPVSVPIACRAVLEALPVAFAVTDAWQSRDRSGARDTRAVLAGHDPFAVDWLAGEKMDLDPSLNPIVREGLLRRGRVRLVRRGNLTPWEPWRNATPLGAVIADALRQEDPLWTTR